MAIILGILLVTSIAWIEVSDFQGKPRGGRPLEGSPDEAALPACGEGPQARPPARFVENLGQHGDGSVRFYLEGAPVQVTFGDGWVAYCIRTASPDRPGPGAVVRVTFGGANDVTPEGIHPQDAIDSVIRGNDPARWLRDVGCYGGVAFRDLWDGIDLIFNLDDGRLKYDYIVGRGADPSMIVQRYEGAGPVRIDDGSGDLVLRTPAGEVRDSAPVCYQRTPAGTVNVEGAFRLLDLDEVGFVTAGHDPELPLVIDPELDLCTYIGSNDSDYADAVFIDDSGAVYVTGSTSSLEFPTTPGAYDTEHAGSFYDIFVARLSPDGRTLEYSTLIGGEFSDFSEGIHVDDVGRIYLAGYTLSPDFPTTPGAFDREMENPGLKYDLFVLVLDPADSTLVYSTLIGGSQDDLVFDLAVDGSGRALLVGSTESSDFPTTEGAYDRTHNGNRDVFVTRLSADGTDLEVSTLIGAGNTETGYSIELDRDGNVLIAGFTFSGAFPTTEGAVQGTKGRLKDGFVTKLNAEGTSVLYSTFIGGSDEDHVEFAGVDGWGNIYIAGVSSSDDLPTTEGAYDTELGGGSDIFVMKLDPGGASVLYCSYLGGQDFDGWGDGVVGALGTLTLTGFTQSEDFPVVGADGEAYHGGDADAYILRLSGDGTEVVYSTCMGGDGRDMATTLYMAKDGTLCIAGETGSSDLPTTEGAVQGTFGGGVVDVFVSTKWFEPEEIPLTPTADAGEDITVGQHETVLFDGTASRDDVGVAGWTWTFAYGGDMIALDGPTPMFQFDALGVYTVVLNVTDADGRWDTDTVSVSVVDVTDPIADAGLDVIVDQHSEVTFDGGGSRDENGIAFWWWFFSYAGSRKALEGFSPSFTFDLAGSYEFNLEVVDYHGNKGYDTMTVIVRDTEAPVADPGLNITVGQGKNVTLDGYRSRDNVGIASWTWSFTYLGEAHVLDGCVRGCTFDVPGSYWIDLVVQDGSGNSGEATMVVTVLDTMPPIIGPMEDVRTSINETVRFECVSASDNVGIVSWRWSFQDVDGTVVLDGPETTHAFSTEGVFRVTLAVADRASNTAEGSFTVLVLKTPDDVEPSVRPHPHTGGGLFWLIVAVLLLLLAIATAALVVRRGAKG